MTLQSRSQRTIETGEVLNLVMVMAAGVFTVRVLLELLLPNVSAIAKRVTVRIDGANTGSGVIIQHQGDRYLVLSNRHVIDVSGQLTIQTFDGRKHPIAPDAIQPIPHLDLAVLQFKSRYRYRVVKIGNSDRAIEGQTIYVSGWADPSPQLHERTYQFLVGNLSGRISHPRDGYGLVYTVSALPGMSGGPILNQQGHLLGINGRAITDVRTGTVNSVLGIDINRYQLYK